MLGFFLQSGDLSFVAVLVIVAAVIIIFFVALVIGFWVAIRFKRRHGRRWAATARELGFELQPAQYRLFSSLISDGESIAQPMRGMFGGREAVVSVRREHFTSQTTGMRRGRVTYHTCCNVRFRNPRGVEFLIKPRKMLDWVLEGQKTLTLGYPQFDEAYCVESSAPQQAFQALAFRAPDNVAVAEQLVRYSGSDWGICAGNFEVFAEKPGIVTDTEEIRKVLSMLSDIAARLELGLK